MRALAFVVLAVAACSSPDTELPKPPGPTGTWAGRVDGTDAFVAVVADGSQTVAYVCDRGNMGAWFFGGAGKHVVLESSGGAALDVVVGDDATGTFTPPGGEPQTFVASATDATVLFRADAHTEDAALVAGWIVLGAETRGALSLSSTVSLATTTTIPPIDPTTIDANLNLSPTPMTPATLTAVTPNTTTFVWGAMGDSYGSGEGAPEHGIANPSNIDDFTSLSWGHDSSYFFALDDANDWQDDLFTCHRSDDAGAPKAQRRLQSMYTGVSFRFTFTACSGATTNDLVNAGYGGPDNIIVASRRGHFRRTEPAQIDRVKAFRDNNGGRLDALYMSIGGNDMGFGDIFADCIFPLDATPGGCKAKWVPLLPSKLDLVAQGYANVDAAIQSKLGNVPVLHSDYPNPIDNGNTSEDPPVCQGDDFAAHGEVGFGAPDDFLKNNLSPEEAVFAYGLADQLNSVIRRPFAPKWTIVPAVNAAGHGVCTAAPYFNLNSKALHTQGHDLDKPLFILSNGILHPNEAGFDRYADNIVATIRPIVDARVRTGLTAPTNPRAFSAIRNGNITIAWNDRSTAENAYEIEWTPARPEDVATAQIPRGSILLDGGGFVVHLAGGDTEQYTQTILQKALWNFRVRACNTGIVAGADIGCGPYSALITAANFAPATPASLSNIGGASKTKTISWQPSLGAIEYVLRDPNDTTGTELRTASTSVVVSAAAFPHAEVGACNRIGCSTYSQQAPP